MASVIFPMMLNVVFPPPVRLITRGVGPEIMLIVGDSSKMKYE